MKKQTKILKPVCRSLFLLAIIVASFTANKAAQAITPGPLEMAINPPTANEATKITASSFQANWTSVVGATGYKLTVSRYAGKVLNRDLWLLLDEYNDRSVSGTSFSVTGLSSEARYRYSVKAVSFLDISESSNFIEVITNAPEPPVATAATAITDNSFVANWDASPGASSYKLYVLSRRYIPVTQTYIWLPLSGYEDGVTVSGTSYTVSNLSHSSYYRYNVKAIGGATESDISNTITVQTLLGATVATAATNVTTTSFKANWEGKTWADSYIVRLVRDSDQEVIAEQQVETNSYAFSSLSPGAGYRYSVRVKSGDLLSSFSNFILVTTIPLAPVAKPEADLRHNSFKAQWNAADGATSYLLRVVDDETQEFILEDYETTNLYANVTGLNSNRGYHYAVKAKNTSGVSVISNWIWLTTKLASPVLNQPTNITTSSMSLNWSAVSGATGYNLFVVSSTPGAVPAGYFPKNLGSATNYTITGLMQGVSYSIYVTARAGTNESLSSNVLTSVYTALGPPVAEAASNITTSSFQANWNMVPDAEAYYLSVWNATTMQFVTGFNQKEVFGISHSVTGLQPSTHYQYSLKSIIGSTPSVNSNYIDVTTSPTTSDQYTVSLSASPVNGGSVNGDGSFSSGASVTVTADPAVGYNFVNWTEGGTQVSTSESYTFTIAGNRNLVANFVAQTPTTYTVALSASPANGGTVSGGGTFNAGITVTAHAAPMAGYTFVNWTENGSIVSSSVSYVFQVTSNRNLVANFVSQTPTTYTVALSASPANGGTVSGGGTFNEGITVTAHAAPMAGYTFVNWTENGSIVSSSVSYVFQVTSNRNLVANFVSQTPTTYTVALSASPANGGTVSGGGTFNAGITVTAHAAPMAGYTFVNWTENGSIVSTSVSYIFQVTSNRNLIANFELIAGEEYSVDLSVVPAASGTVSGAGSFESGSSVTVSATAANGYNFLNWTEGDNVVSSSATYTFTITSDRDLKANFEPEKYTITLTANPSAGGFTNFSSNQFAFGQSVTINANENSNYKFVNWTENGVIVSTNKSFTFTAEANRSLVANFIIETGAEDINEITMLVYPNPTTGIVHVSGISEGAELKVTDISGRLVHSVKADNSTVILDLSSVRHGVYFIRVDDKQYHSTKRVIIR